MTTNFKWSYHDLKVCDHDEPDSFGQETVGALATGNVEPGKLGLINRLIGFCFQNGVRPT